ncbi:serine/threonine-protein kinase ZRK1-like [Castanea sativa]|uniref:serine/threonine-protein kinase ZRK1-like n=1 Tax=Castanea sativa TaxID=21020 RepID=UPI003F6532D4
MNMDRKEKERAFFENGSMVLEKLIAFCNGKSIPIRGFSYEELKQATNNYDARLVIVQDELYWKWYKGSLDGRLVSIRKFEGGVHITEGRDLSNYVINDLVISAKMSAHKNVLKLIGCCLETRPPILVHEFAANGSLANRIQGTHGSQQHQPLTWASTLKIAREIAHAISYLHTAFSRPIIHRDINMRNIFLDQHDVAKLSNFEFSILVPEGETHVQVDFLSWSVRYMSPEYFATGKVTEKADVYSFGVLLLELVKGKNSNDFTQLNNGEGVDFSKPKKECVGLVVGMQNGAQGRCIVDPTILAEEGRASTTEQQLQAVVDLALTCRKRDSEIRPTMVDVTKELMRIEKLVL